MADDLRARIEEALNTAPAGFIQADPESLAFHGRHEWDRHDKHRYLATCAMCRGESDTLAAAVMVVVEEELARRAADGDEVVRCSGLHCLNTEFYGRLEARGWMSGGMGAWLCPGCKTGGAS